MKEDSFLETISLIAFNLIFNLKEKLKNLWESTDIPLWAVQLLAKTNNHELYSNLKLLKNYYKNTKIVQIKPNVCDIFKKIKIYGFSLFSKFSK